MSNNFSFNAPTYFDFNPQNINENDDTLEMYFGEYIHFLFT